MKVHPKLRSTVHPQDIEITANSVIIASDVTEFEETINGYTLTGYEYKGTEYSKDEYLLLQAGELSSLREELAAAKILLGVE